jgi:hypothetical protein
MYLTDPPHTILIRNLFVHDLSTFLTRIHYSIWGIPLYELIYQKAKYAANRPKNTVIWGSSPAILGRAVALPVADLAAVGATRAEEDEDKVELPKVWPLPLKAVVPAVACRLTAFSRPL